MNLGKGAWVYHGGPERAKILDALVEAGGAVGLDTVRRLARIPTHAAACALLQLEVAGLVVRESNPKRQGFLWRVKEV